MTDEGTKAGQKKVGSGMWNWKRRFTLGGVILSILSLVLIGVKGYNDAYLVLLIIGIVVLLIGVFMKKRPKK